MPQSISANKVGMMHECKVNVYGKAPSLHLFDTTVRQSWESSKRYHKFTNLYTGSSWL